MDKKWVKIALIVGLIILLGVLIIVKKSDDNIKMIGYDYIYDSLGKNNFSVVYFGEKNEDVTSQLADFKSIYNFPVYYSNIGLQKLNEVLRQNSLSVEKLNTYVLFMEGLPLYVLEDGYDSSVYYEAIDKYFYNKIPESERYYKILDKASSYIKKVNSKKYTVAVFGKDNCSFCNLYLPIVNDVARDHDLDIYYFDENTYDSTEYDKIMKLDLLIPSECVTSGISSSFTKGFAKPMTLITKSGKTVGCIKGYVKREELESKLREFKLIK